MHNTKSGFSIILAMGLTLLLSLTGLYVLEYVVPFSRNVKGIESASNSFYQAYAGLEQAMYFHSQNTIGSETGALIINPSKPQEEYSYKITATGSASPIVGKGNSEYDKNYNKLSQAEPAQFVIGSGRLNTGGSFLRLSLKIPDINTSMSEQLSNTGDIVLWQLSSSGQSLTAGAAINHNQINTPFNGQFLNNSRTGTLLNGTSMGFRNFYNTYRNDVGEECIFKVSLISPIYSNLPGNPRIPYLEYQLRADPDIPLREAVIQTQGKSYGFRRNLEVLIPQTTTNSAFDFTVFQ